MSATPTLLGSGSWTDFFVRTEKSFTTAAAVNIGDRIFLSLGSTVADTVWPPVLASWSGIMALTDQYGNVYTRDTPISAAGTTTDAATPELWSAYAKRKIPSGTALVFNVLPGTRGLSAHVKVFKVAGLAEAVDGSVSPFDVANDADESGTAWGAVATGTLAQADEFIVGVHAAGTAPGANWFTDTNGFTKIQADDSSSAPGSARGLSVLYKETAATTSIASTGTVPTTIGWSAIAAYRVATSTVTPSVDPIQVVQNVVATTAAAVSQAVVLPAVVVGNFLVVVASVWKTGGADPAATISDSGNVWTAAQAVAPSTAGGARVYIWTSPVTSGGSRTITVTANASAEISVSGSEWAAAVAGSTWAVDQKNKNTGTATSGTPGSVTGAFANEIYLAAATEDAGTTFFNLDNWAELYDLAANQDLHIQYTFSASPLTTNPAFAWIAGSSAFAAQVITFRAIAPPSGPAGTLRMPGLNHPGTFGQQLYVPPVLSPPPTGGSQLLAAVVAGVASMAAALKVTRSMQTSIAGTATMSPALKVQRALTTSIAGQATIAAALKVNRALSTVIAGVGAVTAALSTGSTKPLATAISGTATMNASLAASRKLQTAPAGTSTVTAALTEAKRLQTGPVGSAIIAASLKANRSLATAPAGQASIVSDLTIVGATGTTLRQRMMMRMGL